MSSRREEKERLRAERIAAQAHDEAAARRRLMLGYIVAGALTLAVVAGLALVIASSGGGDGADTPENAHIDQASGDFEGLEPDDREGSPPPAIQVGELKAAANDAGCQLMEDLPDEGNSHLQPEQEPPAYATNPPTSGNHIVTPLQIADGAYTTPPEPVRYVHSLEHGRVEVQYKPNLPEDQQLALKGVFDDDPAGMLLFPNPDMPYQVAATAWTNLLGCPTYNETVLDAIRDFRDTYRGQGPEAVPL